MANAPGSPKPENLELFVPVYDDEPHESAFRDMDRDFTAWSWFVLGWMPEALDVHLRLVVDWADLEGANVFDSVPITAYTIRQALDRLSNRIGGTSQERVLASCRELEVWNDRWAAKICQPRDPRAAGDRALPVRTMSTLRKAIADLVRYQPNPDPWLRFGGALGTWWAQDLLDRKSAPNWNLIVQTVRAIPTHEQAINPILQALGKIEISDSTSLVEIAGCFPHREAVAAIPPEISDSDTEDRNTNAYRFKQLLRRPATGEIDSDLGKRQLHRNVFDFALALERSLLAVPRQASTNVLTSSGSKPEMVKPHWDIVTRTLTYEGVVIRKVAGRASTVIRLYNAFQEAGWTESVDYQIVEGWQQRNLLIKKKRRVIKKTGAILSLNDNLKRIRFRGDGGTGIFWTLGE